MIRNGAVALTICLFSLIPRVTCAEGLQWVKQYGTDVVGYGVSTDGLGNVYMSGSSFVSKYDSDGNMLWVQQLGTDGQGEAYGVSADGLGNVYISGQGPGDNAYVSKYDGSGAHLWTQLYLGQRWHPSKGVSADKLGNVFISGFMQRPFNSNLDAWLNKYDASGNLLWATELGTSTSNSSYGVSADGMGNVYIAGGTFDPFQDAFIRKYDSAGNLLWTRQSSSGRDELYLGVSTDEQGNVYTTGYITVLKDPGNEDIFSPYDACVSKYDASGNLLWTRQLGGTRGEEWGRAVSADGLGNVYMSGYTTDHLAGLDEPFNLTDAFLSKYDASGSLLWVQQFGTHGYEQSFGISADRLGNVYATGYSNGDLVESNGYRSAAFLVKIAAVPEPSTLALGLVGAAAALMWRRRALSAMCHRPA